MQTGVISTGSFLPDRAIPNEAFSQFPEASIRLIAEKTGIKVRRHADESSCTSDLATAAAVRCLGKVGFAAPDLDAIVLATSSPDRIQPATATAVQHSIGAHNAFAFDVNSACTGGLYALAIADSFVKAGKCKHVLVVAAELYSRYLNPRDFSTYPYFGDGAGAVLVGPTQGVRGIRHTILRSDGSGSELIQIPAGGTRLPYYKTTKSNDIYFTMCGREVFSFAVNRGAEVVAELLRTSELSLQEVKFVVPHQANINIIKQLAASLGAPVEKFVVNLDKYGNTAAASVLIALDEVISSGSVQEGDKLVLVAFGGGLSWGASLVIL